MVNVDTILAYMTGLILRLSMVIRTATQDVLMKMVVLHLLLDTLRKTIVSFTEMALTLLATETVIINVTSCQVNAYL